MLTDLNQLYHMNSSVLIGTVASVWRNVESGNLVYLLCNVLNTAYSATALTHNYAFVFSTCSAAFS
jgi:hypothetical protein